MREIPEGTCVGFAAVAGMKEYQEKAEWKKDIALSVRYVYAAARKIHASPDGEDGTDLRSALKVLNKTGVPPADCWPYKPYQEDGPCANADELAGPYRIERYVRLRTEAEMKESLFINGPFVAGVEVFWGAWEGALRNGIVRMPGAKDESAGGHAICIVGYDDGKKRWKSSKLRKNGIGNLRVYRTGSSHGCSI